MFFFSFSVKSIFLVMHIRNHKIKEMILLFFFCFIMLLVCFFLLILLTSSFASVFSFCFAVSRCFVYFPGFQCFDLCGTGLLDSGTLFFFLLKYIPVDLVRAHWVIKTSERG